MYDRANFKKKKKTNMCFHFLWDWLACKVNATKKFKDQKRTRKESKLFLKRLVVIF